MLQITLHRLRFYAYHGVLPQEQRVGADYEVSLVLTLDELAATAALERDELSGTVNYAEVYELVKQEMAEPSRLLENVAYRMAQKLKNAFPLVQMVRVSVTKVNPPMGAVCAGAEVTVEI